MKKMCEFLRNVSKQNFYKRILLIFLSQAIYLHQANAQGTTNVLTIPQTFLASDFVGTGNFNALIFGNMTSVGGDTEGRLAIGKNFSLSSGGYSIGMAGTGQGSVDAPTNTDNFIVNGNFYNGGNNWQVRGNFFYNTSSPGTTFPSQQYGTTTSGKTEHIKFADDLLKARYQKLSTGLAANLPNGEYSKPESWSPVLLTGTHPILNIFNITLPNPHNNSEIYINIPAGSTALVNVSNTTVSMTGGSMKVNNDGALGAATKVLFNFPNATSISIMNYAFLGSVLAPKADFSGHGGSINGQSVIGGNVNQSGGFEFHNFYFTGSVPTPPVDTPLPVTLSQFDAAVENQSVSLHWITATESGSSRFDVEHSLNGKAWKQIGTVAAHGDSKDNQYYAFTHNEPANGQNLYRLKMVDLDQTFTYSRIRHVEVEARDILAVFPNPVSERILLTDYTNVSQITLTNLSGRRVYQTSKIDASGIDCRAFESGRYVITVARTTGAVDSRQILIRK
jgi:choice-of-anchor A domain-containing protein